MIVAVAVPARKVDKSSQSEKAAARAHVRFEVVPPPPLQEDFP